MSADWRKPLEGIDTSTSLPEGKNADGKSLVALQRDQPSSLYERFPAPLNVDHGNAFDFHVYFRHTDPDETRHAHELHARIRREFPELRIYRIFEEPVGPHGTGMFGAWAPRQGHLTVPEVNTFTPIQTGALFGFLTVYRGPLSVLIHPNTGDDVGDHFDRSSWMGERWPISRAAFARFHRVAGVLQNSGPSKH